MKLYLDSANLEEIKRIYRTTAISGVTTNPSLMAKEKKGDYAQKLDEIANFLALGVIDGVLDKDPKRKKHLSVEVLSTDPDEIEDEGFQLYSELNSRYGPQLDVHVKVPVTVENLSCISYLTRKGVKVNATACMIPSQAKMAMDAGAHVVSFFYNRMKDGGDSTPDETVKEFSDIRTSAGFYQYEFDKTPIALTNELTFDTAFWQIGKPRLQSTQIICGSIRQPGDVFECWRAGADAVTAPMKIIELMMSHPQTDKAIEGFTKDIDEWLK